MEKERRINIRVSESAFKQLDDLRHAQGTTWQELGVEFFTRWLATSSSVPNPEQPAAGVRNPEQPGSVPLAKYPHGEAILDALGRSLSRSPGLADYLATVTGLPVDWLDGLTPTEKKRKVK